MTAQKTQQQQVVIAIYIFVGSLLGVLTIWAAPLLEGALMRNEAVFSQVGWNRLLSAIVLATIAAVTTEGEMPNNPRAIRRSVSNAFFRGVGILALLEKLTGG